jgi:hypothetical protein
MHRAGGGGGGGGASCTSTTYNGGPLMQEAKIVLVMWSASAAYKDDLSKFYAAIVQSPYMDWLREYDVPPQTIVRGSFAGAFVDASPPSSTTVDEVQDIQPELARLVDAGLVPPPDANTLYMIHFPPGVIITQAGDPSCNGQGNNSWCAFHGNIQHGAAMLRYGVIPDMSDSGCASGCNIGNSSDPFIATTGSASHEMMETITDPDDSTGYLDNSCDELADMCDELTTPGSAGGYTVELIWSRKQMACVDHDPMVSVTDFSLALDHATVQAAPGATATVHVTAAPSAGSAMLSLTVDGMGSAATATLSPASMMTGGSSTLSLAVAAGAQPGSYPFHVTAASTPDNVIHTVGGTLQVAVEVPDLAMPAPADMAMSSNGHGNGNGNGNGGAGPDGGAGGNSNGNGNGDTGGPSKKSSGGCSFMGGAAAGPLPLILVTVALTRRRRR